MNFSGIHSPPYYLIYNSINIFYIKFLFPSTAKRSNNEQLSEEPL